MELVARQGVEVETSGAEERYRVVDGLRTFSRCMGQGEAILLLHGAGVSSTYWQPAQQELARAGYRVHALDFPGFGRSQDPPWPPELPRLAQHVLRWLEAEGLDQVHLISQSVGCEVGVLVAAALGPRVKSLTLAGPAGLPELRSLVGQLLLAGVDAFREPLRLFPAILPDYFRCGSVRLLRILREQQRCRAEPLLPALRCPVLLCAGHRDAVVTSRRMAYLRRAIPHGQVAYFAGAHGGHYTHPADFTRLVIPFLRGASQAGFPVSAPPAVPAGAPSSQ